MLLLTELPDQELDLLGLPAGELDVKPRLTARERSSIGWLQAALPDADGVRPRRALDPGAGAWAAVALVGSARRSQYDAMLEQLRTGPPPAPVAALALTGDGFHGNRGRAWRAARGNVHLSCAVPLDLPLASGGAAMPAVVAVAICDALAACAPALEPRIKWVNDVLLGPAKVAGVLAAVQSRGDRLVSATFGAGVNLAVAPPVPPTLFVPEVTSVADHVAGPPVRFGALVVALLGALDRRLGQLHDAGAAPVIAAYRARCGDVGRRVRVWAEGLPDTERAADLPPPIAEGRVLGLDDDLALRVSGRPDPLHGGRLAHDEPAGGTGDPPAA